MIQFDANMKYSLHPPPPLLFFCSLQMPILQCRVSDIGGDVRLLCDFATSGESPRRVLHLTVARLPPDASHLRHTTPPSFRTICLLIDLSLVESTFLILFFFTDSVDAIVFKIENKGVPDDETCTWTGTSYDAFEFR